MSGSLLSKLFLRSRRAAGILLPAAIVVGAGAYIALKTGLATVEQAGGFLALSFVLLICGLILLVVSLFGKTLH